MEFSALFPPLYRYIVTWKMNSHGGSKNNILLFKVLVSASVEASVEYKKKKKSTSSFQSEFF